MNEEELLAHILQDAKYAETVLECLVYAGYNRHKWCEDEAKQRIADKFNEV